MIAVVVGAGRSGMAACKLLHAKGARVRLLEQRAESICGDFKAWTEEAGLEVVCGPHEAVHFADADIVVPSPAAALASLKPFLPADRDVEVMAEMELAWREIVQSEKPEGVLAVTGTSGKTTTVSLCAAMLEAHGHKVFLGGNIGTPLSEYVMACREGAERADVLVLECSSFQLQTCSRFHPHVAMLLNISENHLDFHADMAEYIEAKAHIFHCQGEEDIAIFGAGLEEIVGQYVAPILERSKAKVEYLKALTAKDRVFTDCKLFGAHNQSNMQAAWQATAPFGVTEDDAKRAVATFEPIENRLELVAEKGGVAYVNDSKCTTVSALKVALEAFDKPVCLLAGGKFKGGDLEGLIPLVKEHVRLVGLVGASRERFEQAWTGVVPMWWEPSLEGAVVRMSEEAKSGEVVLLAPATASFDLFKSYIHRGSVFRHAVRALPEKA